MSAEIPARDLRNDVSGVLRRVEAGERLRVTVSGRPVAELSPLRRRRTWMAWSEFDEVVRSSLADPGLLEDLRELTPDTTDDLRW
jgi:prevent-host-death family protein